MPSTLAVAWLTVAASAAIGWVDGNWSWLYPPALRAANDVQAPENLVASAVAMNAASSANDSFSHRSFHHFMVTRSPNHWCAISWSRIIARDSYIMSVTLDRNSACSVIVTSPM